MAPPYRLLDRTPVFHPMGELLVDPDDDKILLWLCGRWFRALGGHLTVAHGWSADAYRGAFGLNAERPLQAPAVSEAQAEQVRWRLQTDERLQAGMRKRLALARSGRLNQLGRQALLDPGRALERRRRTVRQGERMGRMRAARLRADRDGRARALGFADSEDMIRRRYVDGAATVADLAAALGCAPITVIADMERLGISRRPQDARLAQGRRALAAFAILTEARTSPRSIEIASCGCPGSRNLKNGRHCQIVHADLTSRAYDVRDLVGSLPDPPADDPRAPKRLHRRETQPSTRRATIDDPVDRWTPREYFATLCGITEYNDAGKCRCPIRDDPRPSC